MKLDFITTADKTEGPNQSFSGPTVTIHSKFHSLNHICYYLQNFLGVLFQLASFSSMGCFSEGDVFSLPAAFPLSLIESLCPS
jgi:hypothetical protein